MSRLRFAPVAPLMLALLPLGMEAQVDVPPEEVGWIGIQVEGRALPDGSTRVMIVRVDRGSPAQRAGVRPFDVLLRLDGVDVSTDAFIELGERLRPGLPVELGVLRGDRERTLRVIAGTRPGPMDSATMEEFTARVDSVRSQILGMVDSLLSAATWPDTAWSHATWSRGTLEAARRALDRNAATAGGREARAEAMERAREAVERSREVMERSREVVERTREAMRAQRFGPRPPSGPPPDRVGDSVGEAGIERGGRPRPPGRPRVVVDGRGGERGGPGRPPPGVRFRSPHLLGGRFVAGAELEEMAPDSTSGSRGEEVGRLRVVQVVEGSPASRAGLAPGDVIVDVGGEPVGDLRAFRVRLGRLVRRGRPEMRVVRGDTTLVITLPRP